MALIQRHMNIIQKKRAQECEFYDEHVFDLERHSNYLEGKIVEVQQKLDIVKAENTTVKAELDSTKKELATS